MEELDFGGAGARAARTRTTRVKKVKENGITLI